VLTRPAGSNGFGLSPTQADQEGTQLESFFRFLRDTPDVYAHWRKLVVSAGVSGVKVHDTRLVAVMLTHGISHLLTFNAGDFKRFQSITAVDPNDI
jgi:predicted nucleic acid-binding protein